LTSFGIGEQWRDRGEASGRNTDRRKVVAGITRLQVTFQPLFFLSFLNCQHLITPSLLFLLGGGHFRVAQSTFFAFASSTTVPFGMMMVF
jgi:hypothetical protein